jgi:peptidoglycan/LPS O-acetylase OafA/YrhL
VFHSLYSNAINGSLWTIGFEFFFYLALIIFFPIRKKLKQQRLILASIILICIICHILCKQKIISIHFILKPQFLFELGHYFFIGSFFATFNWNKIPNKFIFVIFSWLAILIIIIFKCNIALIAFPFAFLVLFFGKKSHLFSVKIKKYIGDPSYGIYLYAFPLQQLLIFYFQPTTLALLWTSSIGALLFGICSWFFVEEKFLQLKLKI